MNREERQNRFEELKAEREQRYLALTDSEKLLEHIMDLGRRSRRAADQKSGQKRILMLLNEKGEMSQRDLVCHLEVQPASAGETLRKLEDAELIRRIPDPEDRRIMRVALTEDGRVLAEHARENQKSETENLFGALTEEEQKTLLGLLEKLRADWREKFPAEREGRGPHPGMPGPEFRGPHPGMPGPEFRGPHPGMPGPDFRGPHPGMPGPEFGGPHPGMPGPEFGGPHPGMPGPEFRGPHPGMPEPELQGPHRGQHRRPDAPADSTRPHHDPRLSGEPDGTMLV